MKTTKNRTSRTGQKGKRHLVQQPSVVFHSADDGFHSPRSDLDSRLLTVTGNFSSRSGLVRGLNRTLQPFLSLTSRRAPTLDSKRRNHQSAFGLLSSYRLASLDLNTILLQSHRYSSIRLWNIYCSPLRGSRAISKCSI